MPEEYIPPERARKGAYICIGAIIALGAVVSKAVNWLEKREEDNYGKGRENEQARGK